MKRLVLIATIAAVLAFAAAASAAGDPRICSANRPADCARAAAALAARRHVGGPGGLWQGPAFRCALVGPLKFTCALDKTYTVRFLHTTAGWKTTVTP